MRLRGYTFLWMTSILILSYENICLNHFQHLSLCSLLKTHFESFKDLNLSPLPGRPLSLLLGWTGFGLILMTNPYIFRKRYRSLQKFGSLPGWLDFHIFCGLLGPSLIVFHTNFKVSGLVAISFWSMVIVAVSGIVGRYFYAQVLKKKVELEREIAEHDRGLNQIAPKTDFSEMKTKALRFVGGKSLAEEASPLAASLFSSLVGDAKLMFTLPGVSPGVPTQARIALKDFALAKRRLFFFENFQQYLGYWHSFHLPFAFFMYIVAVIHIISALIFGVQA
jgi:uncharacterized membrane protein YciS (DUF1049 family)